MLTRELLTGYDSTSIGEICTKLHTMGPIDENDLETLAYLKSYNPELFAEYESTLMYEMGLFYKTEEPKNFVELLYKVQADNIKEKSKHDFTPIQSDAYTKINNYNNYSFSAPTSTGKSYLFQQLICETNGDTIVVVPTRALLAEYIYSLSVLLPKNVLLLPFIDIVNTKHTSKRVFVITPERGSELFKYIDKTDVRLFLFDEAQLTEEGIRGMKFDSFVRRVNKKYPDIRKVFAHPFISNPEVQFKKHEMTDSCKSAVYQHRNVGKICLEYGKRCFKPFSPYDDRLEERMRYNGDIVEDIIKNNGTVLFYISKTRIYNDDFLTSYEKYIDMCDDLESPEALAYIKRLEEYLGSSCKKTHIVSLMRKGVVIHHGSIPLKARIIIEQFVRARFARICFSTSTLIQGINMPFDLVWINNFHFNGSFNKRVLDLKNLIGRAGRSTTEKNSFDVGYVVIESANKETFIGRMKEDSKISDRSLLDESSVDFDSDYQDEIDAIKNDSFNTDLNLPQSQVDRLNQDSVDTGIRFIIDHLIDGENLITGQQYYNLSDSERKRIKESFQKIFMSHLRRDYLMKGEKSVLSTAIPIMLWKVQGKSFSEIVSLRYNYLTRKKERDQLKKELEEGTLTQEDYNEVISGMKVIRSPKPQQLPDKNLDKSPSDFDLINVERLNYDLVIYDTYDYLDKVIGLSLKDVFVAAFKLYYDKTKDERALLLSKYIEFGTKDSIEIWLLRYGFSFEEIEWLKPCVKSINEEGIVFNDNINEAIQDIEKYNTLERFM